jgi:hypothetical protein
MTKDKVSELVNGDTCPCPTTKDKVSELVNSDTCPRPTTDRQLLHRGHLLRGQRLDLMRAQTLTSFSRPPVYVV